MLDLEPIRARHAALAASAPWHAGAEGQGGFRGLVYDATGRSIILAEAPPEMGAFIAHASVDIPALLAEVDALRAELGVLRRDRRGEHAWQAGPRH